MFRQGSPNRKIQPSQQALGGLSNARSIFIPRNQGEASGESPAFWKDISRQFFRDVDTKGLDHAVTSSYKGGSLLSQESVQRDHSNESPPAAFEKSNPTCKQPYYLGNSFNKSSKNQVLNRARSAISLHKKQQNHHLKSIKDGESFQTQSKGQGNQFKYGPLFSFYDYYQDFANDLGAFADLQDQEELALLKRNAILDTHFHAFKPARDQKRLLGYTLTAGRSNKAYSPDYFNNCQSKAQSSNIGIDEQLKWLEQELRISQKQVRKGCNNLKDKIEVTQQEEAHVQKMKEHQEVSLEEQLMQTLILLETQQISESIIRVKASRPKKTSNDMVPYLFKKERFSDVRLPEQFQGRDYLVQFDPSVRRQDEWVSDKALACFNLLREDMQLAQRQIDNTVATCQTQEFFDKAASPKRKPKKRQMNKKIRHQSTCQQKPGIDTSELGFCHHCKQFKTTYIMAKCRFESQKHGVLLPISNIVNGIQLYNVEPHSTSLVNQLILKKVLKDKKKRKEVEDTINQSCEKQFCSFCLKNYYDIALQDAQLDQNWICPYCIGQCFCSRCMRQDQLTKVRAYLISLNLQELLQNPIKPQRLLTALTNSSNVFDEMIKSNFERIVKLSQLANPAKSTGSQSGTHKRRKKAETPHQHPLFIPIRAKKDNYETYLCYDEIPPINKNKQIAKLEEKSSQLKRLAQLCQDEEQKEHRMVQTLGQGVDALVGEIINYSKSKKKQGKDRGTEKEPKALMLQLDPLFKKIDRNFQSTSSSSNTTADSIEIAKKTSEVESIIALKEAHSKKGVRLNKRDKKYEKKICTRVSFCKV